MSAFLSLRTFRSMRRRSQERGSIDDTVNRPRGGNADRLPSNQSACRKLQYASGNSGYTSRTFRGFSSFSKDCLVQIMIIVRPAFGNHFRQFRVSGSAGVRGAFALSLLSNERETLNASLSSLEFRVRLQTKFSGLEPLTRRTRNPKPETRNRR